MGEAFLTKTSNDTADETGGFVAQPTQPTNTKLLWVDTANGGIVKYYNTSTNSWVATGAAWS